MPLMPLMKTKAPQAVIGHLVAKGLSKARAVGLVSRAIARVPVKLPGVFPPGPPAFRSIVKPFPAPYAVQIRRRLPGAMLKGLGDDNDVVLTPGLADPAGQSWLDRTTQIMDEYKDPAYDKSRVHSEAQIAMQGISALLTNRFKDLTQQMAAWLYAADDILDGIQKDTLSSSFESPWKTGAEAFGQQLKSEIIAGGRALAKTPQQIVDAMPSPWLVAGGAVAALIGAKMLHLI